MRRWLLVLLLAACERDALPSTVDLAAAPTCANNSDCHAARCLYPDCIASAGVCGALDGGCGLSEQACCATGCVAGHRCVAGICDGCK